MTVKKWQCLQGRVQSFCILVIKYSHIHSRYQISDGLLMCWKQLNSLGELLVSLNSPWNVVESLPSSFWTHRCTHISFLSISFMHICAHPHPPSAVCSPCWTLVGAREERIWGRTGDRGCQLSVSNWRCHCCVSSLVFPSLPAPLRANIATGATGENQCSASMFFLASVWHNGRNSRLWSVFHSLWDPTGGITRRSIPLSESE